MLTAWNNTGVLGEPRAQGLDGAGLSIVLLPESGDFLKIQPPKSLQFN